MSLVENVSAKIAAIFTPEMGKITTNTSSAGMAGAMTPANLSKFTALVNQAIESSFQGDEFSANIAKLLSLKSMRVHSAEIFAASFGDDVGMQEKVIAAYESKDDLKVIQSNPDFARHVKPYADQARMLLEQSDTYKTALNKGLEHRVLPIADVDTWLAVVDKLSRLPKKESELKVALKEMFPTYDMTADFAKKFLEIKGIFNKVFTKTFKEELRTEYSLASVTASADEKDIIASSGSLLDSVPWLTILNRCERASNDAFGLTGYHAAAELATSNPFMLDFSGSHAIVVDGSDDIELQASVAGTALLETLQEGETPLEHDFEMKSHEAALAYHILAFAEAGIFHKKSSVFSPIVSVQPNALVDIKLHALYPYLSTTLANTWKCFMPETNKFSFFEKMSGYVRGKRATQYIIRNIRPELQKAIASDLDDMIKRTRELSITGRDLDVARAIADSREKLVEYDLKLVTPFPDQQLFIDTDATSFVSNGIIKATTTRPVGILEIPLSNTAGFSEFVLVRDKRQFDAITSSAATAEVGKMYNSIIDINAASDYAISETANIENTLTKAVNDILNGIVRRPGNAMGAVQASEYVDKATFTPINGDFYLQNVKNDVYPILVQAGLGQVKVSSTTVGNYHGSFTFGEMSGQAPGFALPFSQSINRAMDTTLRDLFASYGVRKLTVDTKLDVNVDLSEDNLKYEKRILDIDSEFTELAVNPNNLLSIAASPLLVGSLQNRITPQLVADIRHGTVLVRSDMNRVMEMLAENLYEQLLAGQAREAVDLMFKGMSAKLSIEDIQRLNTKAIINGVNSTSNVIADSLATVDDLTFVVFIQALIRKHSLRLVTDEIVGL